MPLQLGEFGMILGLDWLSNHNAKIDCKEKKVIVKAPSSEEIVFKSRKEDKQFLIIIQAKRLLRQGCEAYLTHVVDTNLQFGRN